MIQQHKLLPSCARVVYALALFFISAPLFAQTTTTEPAGVSGAAQWQILLGLMLIIGILFSGAYFLRKLNGGKSFGNTGPLRIMGGLMLSARERIVLIEVGDTWIVVGIVPGQIKTLHTLPKRDIPTVAHGEKPFVQWLKHMTERHDENK